MAAKRKYYNIDTVGQNTARRLNYSNAEEYSEDYYGSPAREQWPERVPNRKEHVPNRKEQERVKRRKRNAVRRYERQGIDFFSFLILVSATAAVIYVCVGYLEVQASILQMTKSIAEYESNINHLKNDNDAALNRINTSVDLEHVFDVATKELGMVFSNNNRVFTYESIKSDYIRKYGDIPEAKDKGLIEKILN